MSRSIELKTALEEFIDAVEATGGVFIDCGGEACPHGDPEWTDLGSAYLSACRVLKRKPKVDDTRSIPS